MQKCIEKSKINKLYADLIKILIISNVYFNKTDNLKKNKFFILVFWSVLQ
jgi:hypothetical protein